MYNLTKAYAGQPAIVVLTTSYALFNLLRPVSSQPPGNAATYHCYAMFLDIGLIPFLAYIAMLAASEYGEPARATTRWTSIFNSTAASTRILLAMWVLAAIEACLLAAAAILCIYLIYIFRKISQLPEAMNPLLDDNVPHGLSMHREKLQSDITGSFISLPFSSHSRLSSPTRDPDSECRRHQGNDDQRSDRDSSKRASVVGARPSRSHDAQTDAEAQSKRTTWASEVSLVSTSSVYSRPLSAKIPPLPRKSSKRSGFFSKWSLLAPAIPSSNEQHDNFMSPVMEEHSNRNSGYYSASHKQKPYQPLPQALLHWDDDPDIAAQRPAPPPKNGEPLFSPLRMNPPTPKTSRNFQPADPQEAKTASTDFRERTLSDVSGNSGKGVVGAQKSRFYGDLFSTAQKPSAPPTFGDAITHDSVPDAANWGMLSAAPSTRPLTHSGGAEKVASTFQATRSTAIAAAAAAAAASAPHAADTQGRIVSRTGADIGELSMVHLGLPNDDDDDDDTRDGWPTQQKEQQQQQQHDWLQAAQHGRTGLRGRNVSGKAVEEGRAGIGAAGRVRRVPTDPMAAWGSVGEQAAARERLTLGTFEA